MTGLYATSAGLVVAALALLGCQQEEAFQPVLSRVDDPQAAVRVFLARDLDPGQYTTIGPITGESCQNTIFEPLPSEHDAILLVERNAYAAGADAIIDMQCRIGSGRTWSTGCLNSFECKATAVKLKPGAGQRPPAGTTATGSGFVVSREGHVITNEHVVENCASLTGYLGGEATPLAVIRTDKTNDVALLRMGRAAPAVASFRDGKGIRPGDDVVAIGYPLSDVLSSDVKVTTGAVTALAGIWDNVAQMQVSAPIQPGSSGGPLLDRSGNVVGINSSAMSKNYALEQGFIPQNVNFAIKSEIARALLETSGVAYLRAASGESLSAADVAERAKAFTLFIECRY